MKAIQHHQYGDPDVLKVVDVDEPHAGPGEIRIGVRAAGVNAVDWKICAGHLQDFMPLTLPAGSGLDAAGIVDEVGDGVQGVAIGDAVFGTGSNTYAEHAVLTDWARKPEGLPFEEAAGYPVAVSAAQRILDLVEVERGQTVLISGAAGGVGTAAVQFARTRGATVIGTASQANQGYLEELGAIPTTYGDGLVERVRALAPDGVDAALDVAGSGVIAALVELTGDPSKVVSIADFTAGEHGAQVSAKETDRTAKLAEAARQYKAGNLRVPVANTFALHEAAAAHQTSRAGHVAGRTIIVVDPGPEPATPAARVLDQVTAWPGITTRSTPRGATAIVLDDRELGHVHLDRATLDLPLGDDRKAEVLREGRAKEWFSDWVSKPIAGDADVTDAITLLREVYDKEGPR